MELWQLQQMQGLPLEIKIIKTQMRIREWYEHWNGEVYVSLSGGKDSTVLLHLVREMYPDVDAVFSDTGLEYPEIREFVKTIDNVTWIKPQKNFRQVANEYGYPIISKELAHAIYYGRKGSRWAIKKLYGMNTDGTKSRFNGNYIKYQYLMDAPFEISNICCNELKKKPFKQYEKVMKKKAIVGTMASESEQRKRGYLKTGCNSFENKHQMSRPLGFWLEHDIWDYIHSYNIPYSKIYDMGAKRTGCMFCMFGCHLEKEPNRFQQMQEMHPKQWEYCMKSVEEGGLGLAEILDYIGVPWKSECWQMELKI